MDVISLIVGILGLCVGVLAFGYQLGKDSRGDDCGESHRKNRDKKQK